MRNWLLMLAVLLIGLAIVFGLRAQDAADTFLADRASRARWIESEIFDLQMERLCVIKSKNRAEMRKCNR